MQLEFEHIQNIKKGNYSDLIHLWDNEANNLYIQDGRMRSQYAYTPNGEWDNRQFMGDIDVSVHDNIENFRIDNMGGWGAIGAYKQRDNPAFPDEDKHYLLIYEYQQDVSEYLATGQIKHSINTPISSFQLTLENPKHPNPKYDGNVVMDEKNTVIKPGSKVIFKFGAGAGLAEYEMGTFYVDRGQFSILSSTANIEGRNSIGKILKDQTLNQNNNPDFNQVSEILRDLLLLAQVRYDQFYIENTTEKRTFEMKPNDEILATIETILKSLIDWRIEERADARIIIGSPDYVGFTQRSAYAFYRGKDVFSREIINDDQQSYKQVCVHNADFSIEFYKEIEGYEGWDLKSNKTLFVPVMEGISLTYVQSLAINLAERLAKSGRLETFKGPFRPHILIGDGAYIMEPSGNSELGLITEITHEFGKGGFTTLFTVDSGEMLGRSRLSDYISKIGNLRDIAASPGTIQYPADLTAYNNALSAVNQIDYTPESWVIYQAVVVANVVFESNTQAQVDLATNKIIAAQSNLVLKV